MTVERTNFYIDYDITDPSRVFYEFSFPVKEPNQISCYDIIPHDDTADEIEQIPDGYFTVASDPTPEGYENGGSITLTPGFVLEEGHILRISRRTPKTQAKVFENQNRIWPEEIEDALDRLIMILQEMNADEVQTIINQMEGDIGSIFATIAQFAHHAGRHSAGGEDPVTPASIGAMPEPPADGNPYLGTKNGTDAAKWVGMDDSYVKRDPDGSISFPVGMDINTIIPEHNDPVTGDPVPEEKRPLLDTDNNGNFIVGNTEVELNFNANERPTTQIGDEPNARRNAFLEDIEGIYATEKYVDESVVLKADLVNGKVPESQLPPGVVNFTVDTESDLVTLTTAKINDRAKVLHSSTNPDKDEIWLLWEMPPTNATSWENITALPSGSGVSGPDAIISVNNKPGPAVSVDLPDFPDVQGALDDKADASDLAAYAPLNSPALTGTPTSPNPPASATGNEIMTAAAVNTKLTSNLSNADPLMDGTASPGTAMTVSRADHVHPGTPLNFSDSNPSAVSIDNIPSPGTSTTVSRGDHVHGISPATAATATAAGAPGSVVYAADNADSSIRDQAVTPAGLAAAMVSSGSYPTLKKYKTISSVGTVSIPASVQKPNGIILLIGRVNADLPNTVSVSAVAIYGSDISAEKPARYYIGYRSGDSCSQSIIIPSKAVPENISIVLSEYSKAVIDVYLFM